MNVFILGAGQIGQAISYLLKDNNRVSVEMWDKDVKLVPGQRPLKTLSGWADVVFLCVNSWVMDDAIASIKDGLRESAVVVTVSKGIEDDTGRAMDELLPLLLPKDQPFGILSGPMLATELVQGRGGGAVLALNHPDTIEIIRHLFVSPGFHVMLSSDITGVAYCGVLKNIYAIGLGIAEALEWGDNMKGWYVAQAIGEMRSIISYVGGDADTVLSSAGIGDFVATGFSHHSRNHRLGFELTKTGTFTYKSEGYSSLPALLRKIRGRTDELVLFRSLSMIVEKNATPETIFSKFIP